MSTRTIWTCDGCGEDKTVNNGTGDWKEITVTLEGFKGYPTGDHANGTASYHLCARCQKRLVESANPRQWPRAAGATA